MEKLSINEVNKYKLVTSKKIQEITENDAKKYKMVNGYEIAAFQVMSMSTMIAIMLSDHPELIEEYGYFWKGKLFSE